MDYIETGIYILPTSNGIFGIAVYIVLWSLFPLLLSTLLWRLYYQLSRDSDSKLPLPPGSMGYPFIGETLSFLKCNRKFSVTRREQHGRVYKSHLFGHPVICVIGADNVRQVLMGEHITVEGSSPSSMQSLLGVGTLTVSTYDKHRRTKKLLQQVLSPSVVAGHISDIQDLVRRHLHEWCSQGEVLGHEVCKRLTLSQATTVLIGFNIEDVKLKEITEEFEIFVNNFISLPWKLPGTSFSRAIKARERIIKEIRRQLCSETRQWSFIDELKHTDEKEETLTPDEMANAILELWFAGYETNASTTCSILMVLGRDARARGRIEEELKKYGLLELERNLTFDLLKKLKYPEYVVKEVLRLWPPALGSFREVKNTIEMEGYQIPKGWRLLSSIRDTHETTDIFENKDTFLPERWTNMEDKLRNIGQRFHYLPFSAGARACPGEHFAKIFTKIFIVELIRTCSWELKGKSTEINYFPTPHPADGLPVTFKSKKQCGKM